MTEIATSSVMALSAITPAAMFSYLGIEKYRSKLNFSWTKSTLAFDLQLHRGALDRHVQRFTKVQLQESVMLSIDGQQLLCFIRQCERDYYTLFLNYNSPVVSIQRVNDGWIVIHEDERCSVKLATQFIMTLENRLFS